MPSASLELARGSVELGRDSVDIAAEEPQTGGNVPPVPPGTAVLSWLASTNNYVPADNLDARTGYNVVGRIGPATYAPGSTIRVAFTTAGGAPVDGQTFWLASQQDDANTGRGKATATIPTTVLPPSVYPQMFRQNIVPLGVVVDASEYAAFGTAIVTLDPVPSEPTGNTPAVDVNFAGARINTLSAANYFSVNVNKAQYKLGAAQTLILLYSYEGLAGLTNLDDIISYSDPTGANGWWYRAGRFDFSTGDGDGATGLPQSGLNMFVMSIDGTAANLIDVTNGNAARTWPITNPIPAPAANWILRIGGGFPLPGYVGWRPGGVVAVAMLNRSMTGAEAEALCSAATQIDDLTPGNRYVLPASVLTDPTLLWTVNANDWDGSAATFNTTAGPAGTADTLTRQGAPTKAPITDVWKRDVAALHLDTDPPAYDSLAFARSEQAARVAVQLATQFEVWQMVVGLEADDFDNNDNDAVAVLVNGVAKMSIPLGLQPDLDAITHYYGLQNVDLTGLVAPFTVELVVPDKVLRGGTFMSGADLSSVIVSNSGTFQTAATARRLLVVGDGQTLAGHDALLIPIAPGTGGLITRLRSDYPGRVTGLAGTSFGVFGLSRWGGTPTALPFAKYAASLLAEGAPATREVFVMLGVIDWYFNTMTPALYGAMLGQFLDGLHTDAGGAIPIFMAPPCQDNLYATPSPAGGGHTLQEYVDAANALGAGRPWLTIGDVTGPNPITFAAPTFVPPEVGANGQVALKENIKALIGY